MRAGRAARIVGRATLVGLLGLTGSMVGSQAAVAEHFEWDTVPAATDSSGADNLQGEVAPAHFEWD